VEMLVISAPASSSPRRIRYRSSGEAEIVMPSAEQRTLQQPAAVAAAINRLLMLRTCARTSD